MENFERESLRKDVKIFVVLRNSAYAVLQAAINISHNVDGRYDPDFILPAHSLEDFDFDRNEVNLAKEVICGRLGICGPFDEINWMKSPFNDIVLAPRDLVGEKDLDLLMTNEEKREVETAMKKFETVVAK